MVRFFLRAAALLSADGRSETPEVGPVKRWTEGVVFAALVAAGGVLCLAHAWTKAGNWDGVIAQLHNGWVGTALALVGLGLYIHFRCFWSPSPRFWWVGHLGRKAAGAVLLSGMLLGLFGWLVFG